jgi:hypothetical protein
MRDIQNLNREHDNKVKEERTTCCRCPKGKEIIWCGCDCHDVPMSDEN